MLFSGRRAPVLLFAGDILAFALALYLTLIVRYGTIPRAAALAPYLAPFLILFVLWTIVFSSAGLYGKDVTLFPSRLPDTLLRTQFTNILIAALFFFLIPSFGIAPKTILVLYLAISLALIALWRLVLHPRLSAPRSRERAILLATGPEADELFARVNGNIRYGVTFVSRALDTDAALVVIDRADAALLARDRAYAGKRLISFEELYEEVFDRVPLSRLKEAWFSEHAAADADGFWYPLAKRLLDLVGGAVMGLVTLAAIPFVWSAIRIEGPGPLFIVQERYGKQGTLMKAYKFRSMMKNEAASGRWVGEGENRVTKVGAFLRKTSLDEFPQFINILRGELSLIGPRNDTLGLGRRLAEALPYYEARYRVMPGITGWAQINQQYEQGHISPQSIEETKMRLAYDFYYLKRRSFGLDLLIALRTLKKMFFRVSSW